MFLAGQSMSFFNTANIFTVFKSFRGFGGTAVGMNEELGHIGDSPEIGYPKIRPPATKHQQIHQRPGEGRPAIRLFMMCSAVLWEDPVQWIGARLSRNSKICPTRLLDSWTFNCDSTHL